MGWDVVEKLLDDPNNKENVSSTSKDCVEDKGKNVDMDNGQTDGHVDTRTWYDTVSRFMIGGRNVQP